MVQPKLTPQQQAALIQQNNLNFMDYSFEQPIRANEMGSNAYTLGRTNQFESPVVGNAFLTKVTLRVNLKVTTAKGTGVITPTASYPWSLIKDVEIKYGNKVANFHPYKAKVDAMTEGYARKLFNQSGNFVSPVIDGLLNAVPTDFTADGDHTVKFDVDYELNQMHPASYWGILPLFANGVRTQISATVGSSVASVNADPLDHAFNLTNDAGVTVTGTISCILTYRDNSTMSSVDNLSLDLSQSPAIQTIELPIVKATAGLNYINIRNPYKFAKILVMAIDGKQSSKFASADNINYFSIDRAENQSSSFFKYDSTVGIETLYKETRNRFGTDLDEGTFIFDCTSQNISNPSSKTGKAMLNLSQSGFPSTRITVGLNSVDESVRTPRLVAYGVIINESGIQMR